MTVAVVVPTIREDCMQRFLEEWADELADAILIVVEDNPERTFDLGISDHYSWADAEADLGDAAWIIPRRSSACRAYGFWRAYNSGADIIWTLDDDCYPEPERRGTYLTILERILTSDRGGRGIWYNTIGHTPLYPRGYPYGIREQRRPVVLHHGLWSNVPDLDGITQLANPDFRLQPYQHTDVIPTGKLFPMCIMNLAWRREFTPALYTLLMGCKPSGERWGIDRFDDIWAGLFAKRIADHLGYSVTTGAPTIHHSRASDPHRNAELEAAGIAIHEQLWPLVAQAPLTADTVTGCYHELSRFVYWLDIDAPDGYWKQLGTAMNRWADLYD